MAGASKTRENLLKVLIVSAEVAPFAKAGGLADVVGALPKALQRLGVDVCVAMPSYRMIRENPDYAVSVPLDVFAIEERPGVVRTVEVRKTHIPSTCGECKAIPVFLIGEFRQQGAAYFDHAVDSASIYAMEPDPYVFFDKAVVAWLARRSSEWLPDIVHSNDWHCGLIPLCSKLLAEQRATFINPVHVFTIHNLAYQGEFDRGTWYVTGFGDDLYTLDGLECYGNWSFMKGALNFADYVTTVSPNYAKEILTPEYGNGLDGLLHKIDTQGRLTGILNGIDTNLFDPEMDRNIASRFRADDADGKKICKRELQRELGLTEDENAVVIGMVSRFVEQKGLDLFHGEAERILKSEVQFAMLGAGDPRFESFLVDLTRRHPHDVAIRIEYNAPLAQRIYAGSDLFLMPSRFEPCGLGQLIALRYGTIPIVRSTGGLADTITDFTANPESGNGFVFSDYTGEALVDAVERAVAAMRDGSIHNALLCRALSQNWSWDKSALSYVTLYQRALGKRIQ